MQHSLLYNKKQLNSLKTPYKVVFTISLFQFNFSCISIHHIFLFSVQRCCNIDLSILIDGEGEGKSFFLYQPV